METIIIPTNKGLQFYNTDNIIRIQGMSNYCKIYFAYNSYPLTVARVLHWFEQHLPAGVFWRTHKTHLVNSGYVKQFHTAQKRYMGLRNGEILVVSRRRATLLKNVA
ncbi:MAG: LytTR family DNA-binding domain-containing protein [Ferruginibacter sp.]